MSFSEKAVDNRLYLHSNIFGDNIIHGFTSAEGGVSQGRINGFNLGFRVGDDTDSVLANYGLLSADLSFDINRIVASRQTHTDNIRIVTEDDAGKGVVKESDIQDTDGLITNVAGLPLIVYSADCIPVLLYDPVKGVVGAVHSGWRGTVKGIAPKCVKLMQERFGCKAENILAAVGPSIGACCFEFGSEAVEIFGKDYCRNENDKYKVDLWAYLKDSLTGQGILDKNIDMCNICTVCHSDRYYSYRSHKDATGRQGAVIMLGE